NHIYHINKQGYLIDEFIIGKDIKFILSKNKNFRGNVSIDYGIEYSKKNKQMPFASFLRFTSEKCIGIVHYSNATPVS
ncbi:hypothetical protein N9M32_04075, partial [Alphaproteobacteria bacterium]|nr:hypothetical protein [Alphaproteobacteria bacterium]